MIFSCVKISDHLRAAISFFKGSVKVCKFRFFEKDNPFLYFWGQFWCNYMLELRVDHNLDIISSENISVDG